MSLASAWTAVLGYFTSGWLGRDWQRQESPVLQSQRLQSWTPPQPCPSHPCSAVCLLSCLRELLVADAHAACMGSGECCTPAKGFWGAVLSLLTDYGLWDAFLCLLIADRCLKT